MSPSTSASKSAGVDVVLIDNNPEFITLIGALLEPAANGITLHAVSGGQEALTLELAEAPRLILLDIDLHPDQSGLVYLSQLRAKWPQSQIVMLSFHDELLVQDAAQSRGAAAFLSKWQLHPDTFWLTLKNLGIDLSSYPGGGPPSDGATAIRPGT